MIMVMARRETRYRYAGTMAGALWSVANPLAMICVYWFVFSVGLRVQPMEKAPFIVVFLGAYLPWSTFVEILSNSCACVSANPHLVKKVVFPTEVLPVVQIAVSMISHAALLLLFMSVLAVNGYPPSIYNLQIFYYLPCLLVFSLGLAWLAAALTVFYRDVQQLVGLILTVWFWLTPVVWPFSMLSGWPRLILTMNPLYYIVEGYRKSFITHVPFWADPMAGLCFWGITFVVFMFGGLVFKRLKPEFADVL